jgi:hypothetical protein
VAQVNLQINSAAVRALFTNPGGGVARDMLRRGENVATLAKKYCPVNTGRLRSSIEARLVNYAGGIGVIVGTNVEYAMFQHEGTGIYGPHGRPIVPVNAQALRFQPKGSTEFVFAKSVRGSMPTFFLRRALPAAAL